MIIITKLLDYKFINLFNDKYIIKFLDYKVIKITNDNYNQIIRS